MAEQSWPRSRITYWLTFSTALLCCVLPLLMGPFLPATDLPQHVAQVARAVEGDVAAGQYVAWWAPNNLIYTPMMALWPVFGPHHLGQATLVLLAAIWVLSHFYLAHHAKRPATSAMLASLTLYNGIFYWGMLNFLVAWPCFLLWWTQFDELLRSPHKLPWRRYLVSISCTLLLAWAHVLMLAAAGLTCCTLLVLGGLDKLRRANTAAPNRRYLLALSSFAPVVGLVLPWVMGLRAERQSAGFLVGAHWTTKPEQRLEYLLTESIGCGAPLPWLFGAAVALWLLSGVERPRGNTSSKAHEASEQTWNNPLLVVGTLTVLVAFVLPDKYLNTIQFAVRWLPCGLALICLSAPGPAIRDSLKSLAILCLGVTFSATTTARCWSFQREELSGLEAALDRVPAKSRVLGLDFVKTSENFPTSRPFLHLPSYATALARASTNFDFGQHGTGLIRGEYPEEPWTPGLEWVAEWTQPRDLRYFEYALVGARPELHGRFFVAQWMHPVTFSGVWRLYQIDVR